MEIKYQEALQNLYDMRGKLIDVNSKNAQWANNIEIYDFIGDQLRTLQELVDKMKPIEEELGCTLEVIFKALKQKHIFAEEAYCCEAGEVYNLEGKKLGYVNIDLSIQFTAVEEIDDYFKEFANRWCWQFQYNIDHDDYSWYWYLVKLTDYKKTWWLKEDRSE